LLNAKNDNLFLQTDTRGSLLAQTRDAQLRILRTVDDRELLLKAQGFLRTDRGTILNLGKTEAYFIEADVPSGMSVFSCTRKRLYLKWLE